VQQTPAGRAEVRVVLQPCPVPLPHRSSGGAATSRLFASPWMSPGGVAFPEETRATLMIGRN